MFLILPLEDIKYCNLFDDIFVSKFTDEGQYMWAQTWGSTSVDEWGLSIITDIYNNIFVSGIYRNTVDFNPGPDEDLHTWNGGLHDAYLMKLLPNGYW